MRLYDIIAPVANFPILGWGVALVHYGLYGLLRQVTQRERIARPVLVSAYAWTCFAAVNLMAHLQGASIRVDIVLLWPPLCFLTMVAPCVAVYRWTVQKRADAQRRQVPQ